jgi:hypothetical protein
MFASYDSACASSSKLHHGGAAHGPLPGIKNDDKQRQATASFVGSLKKYAKLPILTSTNWPAEGVRKSCVFGTAVWGGVAGVFLRAGGLAGQRVFGTGPDYCRHRQIKRLGDVYGDRRCRSKNLPRR